MLKVAPPTEEVVNALLDYLVDPMLPLKASSKNLPSLSNQQSVAKQMHAVVLLYNYYQRKQHPELRFLEYEPFCKLALKLKPVLIAHMNCAHQTETTLAKNLGNQLSMTEKAIMDACNISLSLDALKDVSNIEAWPIAKVSVLLIDSKQENCMLLFDSITNGVWSVIEECLDVSNLDSKIPLEGTSSETMRWQKKIPTDEKDAKELDFEHLAFAAVKKAAGINQSELKVLEGHVAYSLTKEKTAAYFYIMQCIQSSKDFEIPIKDAIESLQGPILRWISGTWTLTQVVEYYNVLPYSRIMSNWYLREVISNGSERLNVSSFWNNDEHCGKEAPESEQAILNEFQNFCVGLGEMEINSSLTLENACDGEFNKLWDIYDQNYNDAKPSANVAIGDVSSNVATKDSQEMEKSCGKETVADESSRIVERTQELEKSCGKETVADESSRIVEGAQELEKSCGKETVADESSSIVERAQELEKSCGKETVADESSGMVERAQELEKSCGKETVADESSRIVERAQELEKSCGKETVADESSRIVEGAQELEKSCGKETVADESSRMVERAQELEKSCGKETVADESSRIVERAQEMKISDDSCDITHPRMVERAQEMKISDDSCDITHPFVEKFDNCVAVHSRGRITIGTDNSKLREMGSVRKEKSGKPLDRIHPKQLENCIDAPCTNEGTNDSGNYKIVEIEAEKTEKPDISCNNTHPTLRYCGSKETIVTDNSNRREKGVEETENSDKILDINHSTVKHLENDVFVYTREGTISTDNSKRAEKEVEETETSDTCSKITNSSGKELDKCISANCSGKETIGDNSERIDKLVEDTEKSDKCCDAIKLPIKELSSDDFEDSKQYSGNDLLISYCPSSKRQKMDLDRLMMNGSKNRYKSMNAGLPLRVYQRKKPKIFLESDASTSVAGIGIYAEKAGTPMLVSGKYRVGKVAENVINGSIQSNLNGTAAANCALVSILAEKDAELTQTALGVLFSKRAKLCYQQLLIKDEVACCDENIQKILEGREESLALKLEAIMDGCKDTRLKEKIQDEDYLPPERHSLVRCTRGKRLSDAILNVGSPSQDLNEICRQNNWILAAYSESVSYGRFRANVTVNGMDFECSCWGEVLSTPQEAKESVAARMIAQLCERLSQIK